MSDALGGPQVRETTLREQANAPRIGRARFIGNAIGMALLVLLIEIALAAVGLKEMVAMGPQEVALPNRWVALAGAVLLFLCLVDLAVRRRHDRNRSGVDAALLLLLISAIGIAPRFHALDGIPALAGAAVAALAGFYLLVVLAILPGTKGANRYGPDPRLPH